MLELNDILLEGDARTLSMMAQRGQVTCLTGSTAAHRRRLLMAMLGLEPVVSGFVSIEGEPMTPRTARELRHLMAYAPERLVTEGEVRRYAPPTVQQLFMLRANRSLPISNGILTQEMRNTGCEGDTGQWLAVAVLLNKPILLCDMPPAAAAAYLRRLADGGRTVIVSTDARALLDVADNIVEVNSL